MARKAIGKMNNIIKSIKRVSFELSNLCNYAAIHPQCPASKVKRPMFLSQSKIINVLYSLFGWGFNETIAWYIYNEPTIDPRLIKLVDYTSRLFNGVIKQRIVTNGAYLDQTLLDEFIEAGITYFKIDCYTPRDLHYARQLKPKTEIEKFKVTKKSLDDRMTLYDLPAKNLAIPCYAPYADIQIKCDGRIVLCAIDWKSTVTFGNLNNEPFEDILRSPAMLKTYEKLRVGERTPDVCSRCNRTVTGDSCLKTSKYFKEGK
jgi:radical SAM protein with 4Fe4S-binding SPASM domain